MHAILNFNGYIEWVLRSKVLPDHERVFRQALDAKDEMEVKIYADYPKEIQEWRRKLWPKLKRARGEGRRAFFSKKEPDKLFIEGCVVA